MAIDPTATRRGLFALALGGATLTACGDEPAAPRRPSGESQAATLNSALAFEYAALAAYRTGESLVDDRVLATLRTIAVQERAFAQRLTTLVRRYGGEPAEPRSAAEYRRSFPALDDARDVLTFAADLEERPVRKYLEALPLLPDAELRRPLAQIAVAQGRHLAVVRALRGDPPAPHAFVTGTELRDRHQGENAALGRRQALAGLAAAGARARPGRGGAAPSDGVILTRLLRLERRLVALYDAALRDDLLEPEVARLLRDQEREHAAGSSGRRNSASVRPPAAPRCRRCRHVAASPSSPCGSRTRRSPPTSRRSRTCAARACWRRWAASPRARASTR